MHKLLSRSLTSTPEGYTNVADHESMYYDLGKYMQYVAVHACGSGHDQDTCTVERSFTSSAVICRKFMHISESKVRVRAGTYM